MHTSVKGSTKHFHLFTVKVKTHSNIMHKTFYEIWFSLVCEYKKYCMRIAKSKFVLYK